MMSDEKKKKDKVKTKNKNKAKGEVKVKDKVKGGKGKDKAKAKNKEKDNAKKKGKGKKKSTVKNKKQTMCNLSTSYTGSFPVTIPSGKTAIFMFSIQAANKEEITFIKYPNESARNSKSGGTVYKKGGGQGTKLTGFTNAVLEEGYYTCQMTTNGRSNVKILADQWDIKLGGVKRMTTISAAMEDARDNDYNDLFLQIFWWNYQG